MVLEQPGGRRSHLERELSLPPVWCQFARQNSLSRDLERKAAVHPGTPDHRRPSFDIRLSSSGTAAVRAGFAVAGSLALARLGVGVLFARHACRTVFSREPPDELSALASLLQVTRPLRIAWRLLTARFRTTPDVYILGEVRCGTTTLASMLRSELGMSGPFTPWVHPLADEKESFYFSGHYWGVVAPALYPLAFPLRVWRWLHRWLRGRRLFVFEGCASYLSSPWAPRLVAAVTPRPVLVVCLREPVEQHRSWWRLEQAPLQVGTHRGERESRAWVCPPRRHPSRGRRSCASAAAGSARRTAPPATRRRVSARPCCSRAVPRRRELLPREMSLRLPRDWARSHPLPATVLGIHPPRSAEVSSRSGEIVRDRPRSSSRRLGRSGGGRTSSPRALRCAACRPGRCLFPTGSCRPLTEWGGSPTPSSGGAQSLERIADPHKPSLSLPLALPHPVSPFPRYAPRERVLRLRLA